MLLDTKKYLGRRRVNTEESSTSQGDERGIRESKMAMRRKKDKVLENSTESGRPNSKYLGAWLAGRRIKLM